MFGIFPEGARIDSDGKRTISTKYDPNILFPPGLDQPFPFAPRFPRRPGASHDPFGQNRGRSLGVSDVLLEIAELCDLDARKLWSLAEPETDEEFRKAREEISDKYKTAPAGIRAKIISLLIDLQWGVKKNVLFMAPSAQRDKVYEQILKILRFADELDPDNPEVLHETGEALRKMKHYSDALSVFDRVLGIISKNGGRADTNTLRGVHNGKGYALYEMSKENVNALREEIKAELDREEPEDLHALITYKMRDGLDLLKKAESEFNFVIGDFEEKPRKAQASRALMGRALVNLLKAGVYRELAFYYGEERINAKSLMESANLAGDAIQDLWKAQELNPESLKGDALLVKGYFEAGLSFLEFFRQRKSQGEYAKASRIIPQTRKNFEMVLKHTENEYGDTRVDCTREMKRQRENAFQFIDELDGYSKEADRFPELFEKVIQIAWNERQYKIWEAVLSDLKFILDIADIAGKDAEIVIRGIQEHELGEPEWQAIRLFKRVSSWEIFTDKLERMERIAVDEGYIKPEKVREVFAREKLKFLGIHVNVPDEAPSPPIDHARMGRLHKNKLSRRIRQATFERNTERFNDFKNRGRAYLPYMSDDEYDSVVYRKNLEAMEGLLHKFENAENVTMEDKAKLEDDLIPFMEKVLRRMRERKISGEKTFAAIKREIRDLLSDLDGICASAASFKRKERLGRCFPAWNFGKWKKAVQQIEDETEDVIDMTDSIPACESKLEDLRRKLDDVRSEAALFFEQEETVRKLVWCLAERLDLLIENLDRISGYHVPDDAEESIIVEITDAARELGKSWGRDEFKKASEEAGTVIKKADDKLVLFKLKKKTADQIMRLDEHVPIMHANEMVDEGQDAFWVGVKMQRGIVKEKDGRVQLEKIGILDLAELFLENIETHLDALKNVQDVEGFKEWFGKLDLLVEKLKVLLLPVCALNVVRVRWTVAGDLVVIRKAVEILSEGEHEDAELLDLREMIMEQIDLSLTSRPVVLADEGSEAEGEENRRRKIMDSLVDTLMSFKARFESLIREVLKRVRYVFRDCDTEGVNFEDLVKNGNLSGAARVLKRKMSEKGTSSFERNRVIRLFNEYIEMLNDLLPGYFTFDEGHAEKFNVKKIRSSLMLLAITVHAIVQSVMKEISVEEMIEEYVRNSYAEDGGAQDEEDRNAAVEMTIEWFKDSRASLSEMIDDEDRQLFKEARARDKEFVLETVRDLYSPHGKHSARPEFNEMQTELAEKLKDTVSEEAFVENVKKILESSLESSAEAESLGSEEDVALRRLESLLIHFCNGLIRILDEEEDSGVARESAPKVSFLEEIKTGKSMGTSNDGNASPAPPKLSSLISGLSSRRSSHVVLSGAA